MSGFAIPTAAPYAWHYEDDAGALQRAWLRLAPLAERAVRIAGAHYDTVSLYSSQWVGHSAANLAELAARLAGYRDAILDYSESTVVPKLCRAAALVANLAELARATERRAGK